MPEIAKAIPGRMTKFTIGELSGVNRPAQTGARAVFMKRDTTATDDVPVMCEIMKREFTGKDRKQLADEGKALPDGSFPIVNEADLHNAVRAHGRAADKAKAKSHIIARANAMGMSSALPDGWVSKADPGPGEESVMDKELLKSLGLPENATMEQVVKCLAEQNAKLTKDAAAADAKAQKAALRAAMTSEERDYCTKAKMSDDETDEFLAKPKDKKAEKMAEFGKSDETFESNGVTIRKSEVGAGPFLLMKAMAGNMASMATAMEKAEERAATATFEKRAQDELPFVTGTLSERASMLKAVEDIKDESVRKATLSQLHAGNAMAKAAFSTFGRGGGPALPGGSGAQAAMDKAVEDYRKSHPTVSFAKAYDAVLVENPELYTKAEEERKAAVKAAS